MNKYSKFQMNTFEEYDHDLLETLQKSSRDTTSELWPLPCLSPLNLGPMTVLLVLFCLPGWKRMHRYSVGLLSAVVFLVFTYTIEIFCISRAVETYTFEGQLTISFYIFLWLGWAHLQAIWEVGWVPIFLLIQYIFTAFSDLIIHC